MANLPTGTVTFLFTDIEGSTPLWEAQPVAMQAALEIHNTLLHQSIKSQGGVVFQIVGDEFQAVFPIALQALQAAIAAQQGLAAAAWNEIGPLKVRIAISLPWHLQGNEGEGKRWIEAGLELLGDCPEPGLLLARAKSELGIVLDFLGDFPKSRLVLDQCIVLCQNLGESAGVILSHALNGLAYNKMLSGDVSFLQALIEESIHIARSLGPAGYYSLAEALDLKIWFYMDWLELYDEATRAAEEFLNVLHQSGDTWNRMDLWCTGFISTQRGNFEQARTILEEALSIYTEADNRDGIRVTHYRLSWLSYRQGNCRMAYRHHIDP